MQGRTHRPELHPEDCGICGICRGACPAHVFHDLATDKETTRGRISEMTAGRRPPAPPPCREACPLGQDIQGYLNRLAQGDPRGALEVILRDNPLPATLGYVCHHPCERACASGSLQRPPAIRELKRFASQAPRPEVRVPQGPPRGKGVVVGSGPGGLSSAWALARGGMQVTLYEASHLPGGLPAMAIPPFRLPRKALEEDIAFILRHGVELKLNHPLEPREVTALLQENDFVILACGAPRERKADLPGSDLPRVWSGLDFLRRSALGPPPDLRSPVVVVGGGNMAMDSARWALRSASEVTLIYRRDRKQMPAYGEEVEAALAEGLQIVFRTLPVALEGDREKGVQGIRVQNTAPHGKDAEGRTLFTPLSGSEKNLSAGSVILALGQEGGVQDWMEGMGLDVSVPDRNGLLVSGIYAAGDMVTGPSTMVEAMAGGIACAKDILRKRNG